MNKKAEERYKILSILNVLSEALGNESASSFIKFTRKYLLSIIRFAQNRDVSDFSLSLSDKYKDVPLMRFRHIIFSLLKEYGKKELNKIDLIVNEEIKFLDNEQQTLLRDLSSLIKAANLIKRTNDDDKHKIGIVDGQIRQQIVNLLSVNTENGVKINEVNESLGYESQTMEHKKSYIFPPSGKKDQPFEIYRSICGFLNSMCEGKLNIGVDDYSGIPVGYEEDIEYLHKKHPNFFKSDDDVDAYMRFIQDEGIKRFGRIGKLLFSSYIHFTPKILNRKKYLEISITPYHLGIVTLDGKIFLRTNNATNEIDDDHEKKMILQQKLFSNNHSTNCLLKLHQAYNEKRRVIIKNYNSSNSKTIKDREVECFQFTPDYKMAICYEIETNRNKGFKIDRMGEILVLEEPWEHEEEHEEQPVDVFNMVGGVTKLVSIKMDLFAKNQLIEEFPLARNLIKKDKNDNAWYFVAEVGKIEGLGRFILGVADHVDIIDAPELKNYIAEYTKEHLLKYVEGAQA